MNNIFAIGSTCARRRLAQCVCSPNTPIASPGCGRYTSVRQGEGEDPGSGERGRVSVQSAPGQGVRGHCATRDNETAEQREM